MKTVQFIFQPKSRRVLVRVKFNEDRIRWYSFVKELKQRLYSFYINTNLYLQTIFLFNCLIFCNWEILRLQVHSPIPLFFKPIGSVHDNYLVLRGVKCTQHGTCVPYFPPQSATTYSGQLGLQFKRIASQNGTFLNGSIELRVNWVASQVDQYFLNELFF